MEKYVTKISLNDFYKLELEGRRHVYENGVSEFKPVDLKAEINKLLPLQLGEAIVVALHNEPSQEHIEYLMKEGNMGYEDALDFALYNECYTSPKEGFQTYLIHKTTDSLKSTRDYFENKDIKINKRITRAIYEIH